MKGPFRREFHCLADDFLGKVEENVLFDFAIWLAEKNYAICEESGDELNNQDVYVVVDDAGKYINEFMALRLEVEDEDEESEVAA